MRNHRLLIVATLFTLVPARAAHADVNTLLSTSPRTMALAGAFTALADDASALYYNPAGLTQVDGNYAAVSFFLTQPNLSASSASGPAIIDPPGDNGYALHFAWSPRDLLDGDLGLGLEVVLPHRRALRFTVHPYDEPYFVLYENAIDLLEIRLGAAYELFDFISIGASVLLLAGLDGNVDLSAPFQMRSASDSLDEERRAVLMMQAVLPNREFFTLGMQIKATDELRLGLSFREATFVPIQLPLEFRLDLFGLDLDTLANLEVKPKFAPHTFTFGAAYAVTPDLTASFDLSFALYSQYEIPFGNIDLTNNADPNLILLPPKKPRLSLRNVWIPKLGVEYTMDDFVVRGGYYYFRSFIRSVDAPVLDSDKHSLSAGVDYDLGQYFLESERYKLELQAAAQVIFFVGRETAEMAHSGQVFGTTFGAQFDY